MQKASYWANVGVELALTMIPQIGRRLRSTLIENTPQRDRADVRRPSSMQGRCTRLHMSTRDPRIVDQKNMPIEYLRSTGAKTFWREDSPRRSIEIGRSDVADSRLVERAKHP
jgi:hypothetical protein